MNRVDFDDLNVWTTLLSGAVLTVDVMSFYSLLLVWVSFFLLGLSEFGVIMVFRYRMGDDGIWTAR